MKKFWLFFMLLITSLPVLAQQRMLDGVVYDKNTNERIAKVNVQNVRTRESVYNTLKAEFKINVQNNDQLIITKTGYFPDTVRVPTGNSLIVYLKPTAIALKQVTITDTAQTPQKRYLAVKKEYSKAYGSNAYSDILTSTPGLGAGLSIDAIWNSISRSGRDAARLREVIERDYHEDIINYRFNKTFVASITGLKDPQLSDFMIKYRPGYYLVTTANQYEFIASIRTNLKRYLRNPHAYGLPALITPQGGPPIP